MKLNHLSVSMLVLMATMPFVVGTTLLPQQAEGQNLKRSPLIGSVRSGNFARKSILFETYGQISRSDEVKHLNRYSKELQAEETATACIIAYGGRDSASNEAEKRVTRVKDYLVSSRGIDAARLTLVDGGYREDATTELWIVPQGASSPPVTPTIDR